MLSLNAIMNSELFQNFDWDEITELRMKPPHTPKETRKWISYLDNLATPLEYTLNDKNVTKIENYEVDPTPYNYSKNWIQDF
jgi:hypothetical protein